MSIQRLALTRRQFTLGLAGATLAFPGTGNNIYNPKLAVHTSVWLAEAAARKKRPAEILDDAFSGIQRAGYRRVEVVPEFLGPHVRERTLARLEKLGLEPSIVCAGGVLHTKEAAEACRFEALSLGQFFAGRARFVAFTAEARPDGKPKTAGELETQSYQLNLLGQDLERAGVPLLLNHEAAEMRDDAREWRHALAHTEPRLVSFCLDVECAVRAGANPWQLMEAAGGRLRSIHLRNSRHGVPQETVGTGDIDMPEVAALLRQERYDGFLVVELLYDAATQRHRTLPEALSFSRWQMQEMFGSRPGALPVDMGPHVRLPH